MKGKHKCQFIIQFSFTDNKFKSNVFIISDLMECESCPEEECNTTRVVSNMTIKDAPYLSKELTKNLTVDKTSLSSYRRSLECANDSRPSSKAFGIYAF